MNETKNIVLVTGGTGFIGSHLAEKLLEKNRKVRILALKNPRDEIEKENEEILRNKNAEIVYGDLRNIESLKKAMRNVDVVYHLAAISRPMAITDKEYYDINVKGTENILEVSKNFNLKKFIHVSTVSVLGVSPDGHPLKENEFQYDDLTYGQSKREGEKIALLYHYKYKIPVVIIRPCLVYGPRCMVRLIMFKFIKLGIFPLFNNGEAKIEFVYVDNVVQSLLLAESNKNVIGEVFNITDGKSYKLIEIINTISKEVNARKPLIKVPEKLGFYLGVLAELGSKMIGIYPPFSKTAARWMSHDVNVYDCSYAKKVLGYAPEVNLKQGVRETVKWFQNRNEL